MGGAIELDIIGQIKEGVPEGDQAGLGVSLVMSQDASVEGLPEAVRYAIRARGGVRHGVKQGWDLVHGEGTGVEVRGGREVRVFILNLI